MVCFPSMNVRGINNTTKRGKIFKHIKNMNYDIVFLQETHSCKKIEKIWKSQWRGKIIFDHGESNARGCAILIVKHVKSTVKKVSKSSDGRYLIVQLTLNNLEVVLCNVYAPNVDNPQYFQKYLW